MSLFLCLSRISLRQYYQKNFSKVGGSEKAYTVGMNMLGGLSIEGVRFNPSVLLHNVNLYILEITHRHKQKI